MLQRKIQQVIRIENAGAESCLQGDIEQRNKKGPGVELDGELKEEYRKQKEQ